MNGKLSVVQEETGGRNDGNGCLYAVSENVRRRPGVRRERLLRNGRKTAGGESCTSYVGRTLYLRNTGIWCCIFSGCSLRCIFCQNYEIAQGNCAREISGDRLSEIFLELQEKGAANINLVTATHFAPAVIGALKKAKAQGMYLPVIYNSSGYERVETVQMLEEVVDVWLPDFKYMDPELAFACSKAKDYPEVAVAAIREMMLAGGRCEYDDNGYIQKGVIVRHLILPGHTKNSIAVLDELYETYGKNLTISLMNQYTPLPQVRDIPDLNRRVTKREYEKVLDHALDLGITQGFFQEGGTAKESFIPLFDYEGL